MTWVATAIAGSAVLNYLGSQNAANAQTNAANQANATQQGQYNQTRQDQMPWMNRGNSAGNMMAWLMGLPGYGPSNYSSSGYYSGTNGGSLGSAVRSNRDNGDRNGGRDGSGRNGNMGSTGQTVNLQTSYTPAGIGGNQINPSIGGYGSLATPFSATNWQADPGYAFRLQEGQQALERSGAARGMTLSGAQMKALDAYGQGMASQEYGNAYNRYNQDQMNLYNRLAGIAGTGQQSGQFVGSLGANMANQVGQNQLGAGNANAAAWTAGTGAVSNGLNSWANYNTWNQMQQPGAYSITGTPGSSSPNFGNNWGQPVPYAGG